MKSPEKLCLILKNMADGWINMPYAPSRKIVNQTPYKCYGSSEITCPYCGREHTESYTFHEDEGAGFDMECEECSKSFWVDIEYSIDYTSWAYEENDKVSQNLGQSDTEGNSVDS